MATRGAVEQSGESTESVACGGRQGTRGRRNRVYGDRAKRRRPLLATLECRSRFTAELLVREFAHDDEVTAKLGAITGGAANEDVVGNPAHVVDHTSVYQTRDAAAVGAQRWPRR